MIYWLPQVSEVAVIGLPDPRWVTIVTAARSRQANFMRPKRIVFADTLPKNPSGNHPTFVRYRTDFLWAEGNA